MKIWGLGSETNFMLGIQEATTVGVLGVQDAVVDLGTHPNGSAAKCCSGLEPQTSRQLMLDRIVYLGFE